MLHERREVVIETARPNGTHRRTRIWVVVVDDEVYVRSWRGERAHWFRAALDAPNSVALVAGSDVIPARASLAIDAQSIEKCSRGLLEKYDGDPSARSMVRAEILATTLRLFPR